MIKEHLLQKELKAKVLSLPEHKEIPAEVIKLQEDYLTKFGVNNVTKKYIDEKLSSKIEEEKELKKEFANNEVVKNLLDAFGMYKIVAYKDIDAIAKQYNLYITGLSRYNHPIPVLNLEELDDFTKFLTTINKNILSSIGCPCNDRMTFDRQIIRPLSRAEFDNMFYVMAPKSHLNIDKNDAIVGREVNYIGEEKPKFKYEFKIPKAEPRDPIIFLPMYILDKMYCVIITAWDEVADDLRIRQLI